LLRFFIEWKKWRGNPVRSSVHRNLLLLWKQRI